MCVCACVRACVCVCVCVCLCDKIKSRGSKHGPLGQHDRDADQNLHHEGQIVYYSGEKAMGRYTEELTQRLVPEAMNCIVERSAHHRIPLQLFQGTCWPPVLFVRS